MSTSFKIKYKTQKNAACVRNKVNFLFFSEKSIDKQHANVL